MRCELFEFIKAIRLQFGINYLLLWGCDLNDSWFHALSSHVLSVLERGSANPYSINTEDQPFMDFDGIFICNNRNLGSDLTQSVIQDWIGHQKYVFSPSINPAVPKKGLRLDSRLFLHYDKCSLDEVYAIKGSRSIVQNVGFWNGSGLHVNIPEIWERRRDLRGTELIVTYPPAQNNNKVLRYF